MTKMLAGNQGVLSLDLVNGSRVKDLTSQLKTGYPAIGELIQKKKVLVSVNQEIAHEETEIRDGDEVALLPPFAGGSPSDEIDDQMLVRVQREDFSVDALPNSACVQNCLSTLASTYGRYSGWELTQQQINYFPELLIRTIYET